MDKSNSKRYIKLNEDKGFSIIEALIAISIFSIGFMALTANIWSATSTTRTTAYADQSIVATQDMMEILSVLPIDHDNLDGGTYDIEKKDGTIEVEWETLNATDTDGDGSPDFKTIAIRAFSQDELRMQTYYRRKIH